MAKGGSVARIPLQLSRHCVVASIQIDLSDDVLGQFRADLLELLHSSGAGGVIFDVSGVEVLDVEDFEALRRTMAMAALMGARTVISGCRPGVVSSLVELGADTKGIVAALNLDEAFRSMEQKSATADSAPMEPDELEDREKVDNEGESHEREQEERSLDPATAGF